MNKKVWRFLLSFLIGLAIFQGISNRVFVHNVVQKLDLNHRPYKLPWVDQVSHFVIQGNKSFFTHRGFFTFSWDFLMENGTEILAARAGKVVEVIDNLSGIGFFHGNRVIVEHDDGSRAVYAHIRTNSSMVKVGDPVQQGQPLCLSGMVGATIYPHLHFHVISADGSSTIPIVFEEVGYIKTLGKFMSNNERVN